MRRRALISGSIASQPFCTFRQAQASSGLGRHLQFYNSCLFCFVLFRFFFGFFVCRKGSQCHEMLWGEDRRGPMFRHPWFTRLLLLTFQGHSLIAIGTIFFIFYLFFIFFLIFLYFASRHKQLHAGLQQIQQ